MLERFAVSIAATTILGVLGKLALLYHADQEAGHDWFQGPVDQTVLCHLLLAVFLIFFRGKMMHDDAEFFSELKAPSVFKSGPNWKFLIKLGLLLGYVSWLLWAPAIYFLENRYRFAGFLITSLSFSTIWLVIDILTRVALDWRRAFWIIPNIICILLLVLFAQCPSSSLIVMGLLLTLIIDWLLTDPFSAYV